MTRLIPVLFPLLFFTISFCFPCRSESTTEAYHALNGDVSPNEFLTIKESLSRLKNLSNTIPSTSPGLQRFIQSAAISFRAKFLGEFPQLHYYQSEKAWLRSKLDTTFIGMSVFLPELPYDTFDVRAMSWYNLVDQYNMRAEWYVKRFPEQVTLIDRRELMAPREIGRAALIHLRNFEDLTNDELMEAFQGDLSWVNTDVLQTARMECEKRTLSCGEKSEKN